MIVQSTTWVLITLETFLNPLCIAAAKAALFKGFLHINATRRFGGTHWMWVTTTILPVMLRLTPSLKLFLNSRTSSDNVPLTWPYCPSVWPPRHDNGLLGHGYDTWHRYLIWILVAHVYDLEFNWFQTLRTLHPISHLAQK